MSHLLHVFLLISLHEFTPITDAYQWNTHDHYLDYNIFEFVLSVSVHGVSKDLFTRPGTVNYPGVMIAPGQALPRVHMMICCPGATLPRGKLIEI